MVEVWHHEGPIPEDDIEYGRGSLSPSKLDAGLVQLLCVRTAPMASSSTPSSSSSSRPGTLLSRLLGVAVPILLLASSCSATRLGMVSPVLSRIADLIFQSDPG
ncbi:hypothetical protein NL676_019408 [Syzygium grande]|nr:hypothetical protein NL676_019408 [Syzygium grande]